MDEFSKIGVIKSAIFHSRQLVETFKQFAIEKYDIEFINIDPVNNAHQHNTINKWTTLLKNVPFQYILSKPVQEELMLLIINEYSVRFKWLFPVNTRYTRDQTFTDINSISYNVQMMKMVDVFKCIADKELKATIVFIKLETQGTFAVIVLPFIENNIKDLLKNMNVTFEI
ncbi:hypothetical protein RF11_08246 [Thelohanellus kitauei]|uniref:Serpin domain-containing protein n=1 Tax=Thelohanellus kitauei TaxID=669202 RepID=A0A0C2NBE1_THEKT|nr:hypothetical protein RF11_08246 [Thelohanellus kitauei]